MSESISYQAKSVLLQRRRASATAPEVGSANNITLSNSHHEHAESSVTALDVARFEREVFEIM